MKESALFKHMQFQQALLFTFVVALSIAITVTRVPLLSGASDWGLFAATIVVLLHWHYGANYVLFHMGPSSDPMRTLWDAGIIMLLLALPMCLQHPLYWYLASGATYFMAWVKYHFAMKESRWKQETRNYMRRKSWIEVAAVFLSWLGVLCFWILPQGAAFYAWIAALANLAFIYVMPRHLGFYRMGWNPDEWDLQQPKGPARKARKA